jgi:hypothetical protein
MIQPSRKKILSSFGMAKKMAAITIRKPDICVRFSNGKTSPDRLVNKNNHYKIFLFYKTV